MPRPKRPHIVKRFIKHLKGNRFVVDLGMVEGIKDGKAKQKRIEKFFKVRADAEEFLDEQKGKLKKHGHAAVSLTEEERVLFQGERDRLARAGATITQAVNFFLEHHRPLKESLTLRQLLDRALVEKEASMRPRSLAQFKSSCNSFINGRAEQVASTVTRDEVKAWVLGNGFAAKTQKTYLGDVRALFAWGVQERYMRINPIAGEGGFIKLAEDEEEEISVLPVEWCARLLHAALFADYTSNERAGTGRWNKKLVKHGFRELIGYLAVTMFEGVRPEEAKRTEPTRLDLVNRTLVVTGKAAKRVKKRGRLRRVITLERTAVVWFRLWRRWFPDSPFVPTNFARKWDALREAAGLSDWAHDVLRHTAATYHYAAFANRGLLQQILGHSESEDTLDQHYRGIETLKGETVSPQMGREFWALTPRKVRLMKFA